MSSILPGMGQEKARSIGNPDLLRRDVDAGETADKVRFPDPAAAPLGTDNEAGGRPETVREVRQAVRAETKPVAGRVGQGERDGSRWQHFALLLIYEIPAAAIVILAYFAAR